MKPSFWIQNLSGGWPIWNCNTTIVILTGLFLVVASMCSVFLAGDCFAQAGDENTQEEDLIVARQAEIIPIPFITLRDRTQSSEPSEYFGGNRGQMRAGICNVSLSPLWGLNEIADAAPFYIPDKTIDLVDIEEIQFENLSRDIKSFSKKNNGNGKLDIVAHSLGSRGVLQALVRMAYRERVAPVLTELVFIAPDIDADIFRQELPLVQQMASRITVYASENDKPLKLSHEVHGYPRLDEAGDYLTVLEGVDTIDISNISNRRYSGHLYHLFDPEVIGDLTQLLHTGEPAHRRPALQSDNRNGLPYWRMVPDE